MRKICASAVICLMAVIAAGMAGFAEDSKDNNSGNPGQKSETAFSEAKTTGENIKEEEMTQEEWEAKEKIAASKMLFETKCGKCHPFQNALSHNKTFTEWKETVERMYKKDLAWILPVEVTIITDYLYKINGIEKKQTEKDTTSKIEDAK